MHRRPQTTAERQVTTIIHYSLFITPSLPTKTLPRKKQSRLAPALLIYLSCYCYIRLLHKISVNNAQSDSTHINSAVCVHITRNEISVTRTAELVLIVINSAPCLALVL